jgi:cytochrome c oxidase assembly factor CtaG
VRKKDVSHERSAVSFALSTLYRCGVPTWTDCKTPADVIISPSLRSPSTPPYVAAPRLWGLSPVTDQEIGGLIMWYPGNLPYAIWIVISFYRWFDAEERLPPEAMEPL